MPAQLAATPELTRSRLEVCRSKPKGAEPPAPCCALVRRGAAGLTPF